MRNRVVTRKYFETLMENGTKCLRHYVCPPEFLLARNQAYAEVKKKIELPKVDNKLKGTKAEMEDLGQCERFMLSYNSETVWKTPEVALRNSVFFDLQFWCGMRRGELLSLKLEDMKTHDNSITIIDRRNDGDDIRRDKPAIKTYQRRVWVPTFVWKRLMQWRAVKIETRDDLFDLNLKNHDNVYLAWI